MLSLWYLANGNREINNNISPLICISVPCLRILANDVIMRRVIISLSVTTVHNYNNIVIHEETALAMTFSTLIIQFQADDTELVLFITILFSAIAIPCCLCTIQIWLSVLPRPPKFLSRVRTRDYNHWSASLSRTQSKEFRMNDAHGLSQYTGMINMETTHW